MSEINVTPFVDVMLVLLIVFMVAAPLLSVAVPVDLPRSRAAPVSGQEDPLVVTIKADGRIYLQQTEVELADLGPRLSAVSEDNQNVRIFVRGDRSLPYGRIMEVMGTINVAGFSKVALVSLLPEAEGAAR